MDPSGFNLGYVDDLYEQFLKDPDSVSAAWRDFFSDYHSVAPVTPSPAPGAAPAPVAEPLPASADAGDEIAAAEVAAELPSEPVDEVEALRGVSGKIVENMQTSLGVPTATSVRTVPVKVLEENRRLINHHQNATARPKVSFTHIIAWAIVKALDSHPGMNARYEEVDGVPHRVRPGGVNLGMAIDIVKSNGSRTLVVPNIKNAAPLGFRAFLEAYGGLVDRARKNKLGLDDFAGTTVTITNPGMIGTVLSVPRLMAGQGAIVGIGSISYPPEYSGVSASKVAQLGLSKVMTLTSTYDHRIIQGAESGAFLGTLEKLLLGEQGFYEEIFRGLDINHRPISWVAGAPAEESQGEVIGKQARVMQMIHAFRVRGHLIANLDPLGSRPQPHRELEMSYYGLDLWDLDRRFVTNDLAGEKGTLSLREILDILRATYCQYVGVEYMHIANPDERAWLQRLMEASRNNDPMPVETKLRILEQLNAAEAFERFLHRTYIGHKRFSLEGCETLIPLLDELLQSAANSGITDAIVGMAHRGRLNVLANVVGKPVSKVFAEFEDIDEDTAHGSGDVKYHMGATGVHLSPDGQEVRVSLASNPSHLESVDPVVEGMARARQDQRGDIQHERTLPVLIHGDAAFSGQGVVFETLNLSQLSGYRTGGTVHVVINNQIGFTTGAADARSTHYCTDVAKAVGAPIFHVNGDHPQAAVRAMRIALAYRQEFQKDVVVDLICYRRWGHNEGDEPAYTQPLMYEQIDNKRSVRMLCTERLLRRAEIDVETAERMLEDFRVKLRDGFAELEALREGEEDVAPQPDLEAVEGEARAHIETGADSAALEQVMAGLMSLPDEIRPHEKLQRQLLRRQEQFDSDQIPWALAEALAFGSLVLDGIPVRLSGQDSVRGTFSQRHAKIYSVETGDEHCPLKLLSPDQARFQVYNSSLSEFGVLGFEYGYSVEHPKSLVMWEAQFGDFVNGAQIILDQYLSSAEEKWGQTSNLVMLLPHGYEGQGPEHSSARLERFLQLCSEGNMQVAYPTTPAQYFHLLRRQVMATERKPLIIMTPKSLLRHKQCVSAAAEFTQGSYEEIIDDPMGPPVEGVQRLVLCSGKVYYDLAAQRDAQDSRDVAIVRLEQLYPVPGEQITALLSRYSSAEEVVWVQEEPRNMGAWDFLDERIQQRLHSHQRLAYVGRAWSASTATGSQKRHLAEQKQLLDVALGGSLPATMETREQV
ncbi:MAG: multifunctional oxoglutarate decarboxylase/oxoglutarate dehydrogenase thiamine pyrophosphate-binding subunit/dihydrolipoyllysine-residue succinyltransferase subunit [Planctomycetota bacterium]